MVTSIRSHDRRMIALRRANEVRIARARLKRDLREGNVRIEQILAEPPEQVSTAQVLDLLLAVPKIGPVKAARLLNTARVGQSKTVGGLTDRQRGHLIELLAHA
ncbi:MAG TPA: integration host factor, actinobacterial type [Gaiellaceae bacterium]|jgi:S13-like protein|nr:integration host factor, actinobacterial type [Gaiellaceae bacterium]